MACESCGSATPGEARASEAGVIFFLDIYGKDEKDDLAPSEKKVLKKLAEAYKREVVRAAGKGRPTRGGET